jgi:hypothetical protein
MVGGPIDRRKEHNGPHEEQYVFESSLIHRSQCTPFQLSPISRDFGTRFTPGYASVPTDGSREAYRTGIMAKQQQNSAILAKSIDCLELMREEMLTLQRALERVESGKRGQKIQRPTTRLQIKQF